MDESSPMGFRNRKIGLWTLSGAVLVPADPSWTVDVGTLTQLTATGTVNSVNVTFTFTRKPLFIVSDHAIYKENNGWTWNAGILTATMTIPPNDDIFGLV